MSSQKTIISGYMTEPKVGQTRNGTHYMTITVPVEVQVGSDEDNKPIYDVYYYKASFWKDRAADEAAKGNFHKGRFVCISGTVKVRPYVNKNGDPAVDLEFEPRWNYDLGPRADGNSSSSSGGGNRGNQGNRGGGNNRGNNRGGGNYQNRGGGNGGGNQRRGGDPYQNRNAEFDEGPDPYGD